MKHRILILFLLSLSPLLLAASSEESGGCSCKGAADEPSPLGGLASSNNYILNRSGIGYSFNVAKSSEDTYEANGVLGFHLSEPKTSSDHYRIDHAMSFNVIRKKESAEK